MPSVVLRDETPTGREIASWELPGLPERISARELVRLRVREEVARFNAADTEVFRGLVQPTDTEVTVNGYRLRTRRRLDWEQQADAACRAFDRNGFVMLVGDRQIDDLDDMIELHDNPCVSFIKLVALVGG
ncbi:hypothetical protein Rhe02_73910 [Rhizocola hellebori]|uniref:Uncharacterized protein n=1 Tax=Rhizocola hellebori TaxID=1392758 RepID=A0A8J3VJD6_9ACTN|nr:hypothetical protein [Rhizocola hellebori]GIH09324.1 hypothetical protein Rhe02_73910 [Rhizocola hellebori]